MRLLRKITDYATVAFANPQANGTHSDNDELGDRIPTEIEEGTVQRIVLVHTFTTTMTGATYALEAFMCPDATTAMSASSLTAWDIEITNDLTGQSGTGTSNFIPRVGGEVCIMQCTGFFDADFVDNFLPGPFVAFRLGADSTAGAFTTEVYLYGEPRRFSDMKTSTTTTSTSFKP